MLYAYVCVSVHQNKQETVKFSFSCFQTAANCVVINQKMPRTKELTIAEKKILFYLHTNGKSVKYISDIMGRCCHTIRKVIKRIKDRGVLENKARSGRPRLLSQRDERQILKKK